MASIDLTEPLFLRAVAAIILQPLLWHAVGSIFLLLFFLSCTHCGFVLFWP
jgi:hypothetical protein